MKKKKEKREWLDFRRLSRFLKGRKCILAIHVKPDDDKLRVFDFIIGKTKLLHDKDYDWVRVFNKRGDGYFTIGRDEFDGLAALSHTTFSGFSGGEDDIGDAEKWQRAALFFVATKEEYADALNRYMYGYFWSEKKRAQYRGKKGIIGSWLSKWEKEENNGKD